MVSYRPGVDSGPVREAYSSRAQEYIALFSSPSDEHADDLALVRRHLTGLAGPVLDLGCGPGHWTAWLSSLGADVTGVDMVPEFVAHARSHHPEVAFMPGDMTHLEVPDHCVAGVLSWYSTIHLPAAELDRALREFRRLLAPSGVLVLGFFDSADGVAPFAHKVCTAYRRPAAALSAHLSTAGFVEVERLQRQVPERPDRMYAAIAARAVGPTTGTPS